MGALVPIHELLARIRWDPGFGHGFFELAYLDRKLGALVRVPLERVRTSPQDRFALEVIDEDASVRRIPYHRVRAVWRNRRLIWSRAPKAPMPSARK